MADTFAIVGAGLAGARAVETLRAEGFDGRVVLFGAEAHLPYERPALSKGYLQGTADAPFVHPAEWYAEQDVDLRLGTRVTALDPAAHEVETADGDRLRYTKLLLTTGSSAVTVVPRRRSTSCSAYHSAGCTNGASAVPCR